MKTLIAIVGGAGLGAGVAWLLHRKTRALAGFGAVDSPAEALVAKAAGTHIRQIRRYAFASMQDTSPIVGLTHASYALVLLDTLQEVAGTEAIKAAGYDAAQVRALITKLQDMHAEKLQACDKYLQQVLALERKETNPLPGFVFAGGAPLGA